MTNTKLMLPKEQLLILDKIQTIFVTGEGMPTSANDQIMIGLQRLISNLKEADASAENKPLIKYSEGTFKPIRLSTSVSINTIENLINNFEPKDNYEKSNINIRI